MSPASELRAFGRMGYALRYGSRRQRRALLGLALGPIVIPVIFALVGALVFMLIQLL